MPIVSSSYTPDAHQQKGGGRYVTEDHTDSTGRIHSQIYGPVPDDFDCEARMRRTAAQLDEQLAAEEAEALWGSN